MKGVCFRVGPIETPPNRIGVFMEAKLYDSTGFSVMPLATAYIRHSGTGPIVEWIWVPDTCRRQGYATRLLEFCFKWWPKLELTDGINEAGEALVAKFQREGGA
ncbi:NAT_SF domain containing protein [uncultured Caudovirales phage]|uniref:NAT_SF domain containing protein n=1 Tax=uncultured Caudovirales phage TaxID=2100421 RepID=A0A6J7WIR2_9CAUD|nr:NAT_SF domain containing protein [uncultured Caudovirales phage]